VLPTIDRRQALRLLAGGAAGAALTGQPARRPNILFLFSDDQRFSTLHNLNNPAVETPNLDRLAASGTAFTHACIMGGTIGAVCAPSRAMLMTGQTLFHVDRSIVSPQGVPESLKKPFDLFPEVFRKAGYTTFGTGKWHNGPKLFARCFSTGENIFFGGMADHLQVPVNEFDPTGEYPAAKRHPGKKFSSELFADSAVKFLANQPADKPFLAYVAFTAPHDPRMAPKDFADQYDPEKIKLPENFLPRHPFDNGEMEVRDEALAPWPRTPEMVRQHIAAYYAMITHLDAQIGRVLDALAASPHAENTIVVFAADNGLAVGQHGLLGKQNLYDHSIRVPLIISGRGVPEGQTAGTLCYLLDLFPTLCDLTGLPTPATVEGRSLQPALKNPAARVRDSVFLAYRHFQRGIRTERYKLIKYNVKGKQTTQLFDLFYEPLETYNRADSTDNLPKIVNLNRQLADWMKRVDDPLNLDKPNWGYTGPSGPAAAD
jgi:arylsulfatase A-like enzyme